MKNISINNKNLIDNYQPTPNLYYDIEGKVLDVKDKTLVLEKRVEGKLIEYKIRLKEDIKAEIGQNIKVEKENIQALEVKSKDEDLSDLGETRDIGQILRDLGLEYSLENIHMIENLLKNGIRPSKEAITSYKKSRELLGGIAENLKEDRAIKLLDRGMDLENTSLQQIAQALEDMANEGEKTSLRELLNLKKDLTYKEAEKICKSIYGQRMGKDIYDVIIALDKEGLNINKEKIEETLDILSKIRDISDLEPRDLLDISARELDFTINNLYKFKNNYGIKGLEENKLAGKFVDTSILQDVSLESIRSVLGDLSIEVSEENILLAREFINLDMDLREDNYKKIYEMKKSLEELGKLGKEGSIVKLLKREVNILQEDIGDLVRLMKSDENQIIGLEQVDLETDSVKILQELESIEEKDLIRLIKDNRDFNLKNLKEIKGSNLKNDLSLNFKVVEKTREIVGVFNKIGDIPSDRALGLSLGKKSMDEVSLDNLYESELGLNQDLKSDSIKDEARNFLMREYTRARDSISIKIIKDSIIENKELLKMPIPSLNKYMEDKVNRYREISELTKGLREFHKNKDLIIPLVMKNKLPMTLGEIRDINDFFTGKQGLSKSLNSSRKFKEEYGDEIKSLQEDISQNIKEGKKVEALDYERLINYSSGHENKDGNREETREKFLSIQAKLSRDDLIIQLPVEIGGAYKDLNIILPDQGRNLSKGNMNFSINLYTENLGIVNMDLEVIGREIFLDLGDSNKLEGNIKWLEDSFSNMGYQLRLLKEESYE